MEELNDKFYYVYSSSLPNRIQVKIGTLEGTRRKPEYTELLEDPLLKYSGLCQEGCSDLKVICQVFDQNQPLSLPVSTSYKPFTSRWSWNEWLTLPIQFSDLPRTAQLALTIYDCVGPNREYPIGGTTISLFSKYGQFREGMVDLRVFPNREADGRSKTETPGKAKGSDKDNIQRLTKLTKKHHNGHMTKVDWLDRLLFRELGLLNNDFKNSSEYMFLMIEFPKIIVDGVLHHVVYFEDNGEEIHACRAQADIVTVPDQEIKQENLVETKHYTLARSLRSGYVDKDAKPNATIRDKLNAIVSYPPTKPLSNKEQDIVWTFRFYLSNQKKALTKFLKCVNWTQQIEVDQALNMMNKWALMDVEDALELLCPNFTHPAVRKYAVSRLRQAPDEDILLYLPQLVQALKYENFQDIHEGFNFVSDKRTRVITSFREKIRNTKKMIYEYTKRNMFIINNNLRNEEIPWVIVPKVNRRLAYSRISPGREIIYEEKDNQLEKKDSRESTSTVTESTIHRSSSYNQADNLAASNVNSVVEVDTERANSLPENVLPSMNLFDSTSTNTISNEQDLATFLIQRTSRNSTLANYFYWYLLIECEDQEPTIKQNIAVREMYLTVMKIFSQTLAKGTPEMQHRRSTLAMQQKFIDNLVKLVKTVLRESGNRKKKTDKLQQLLGDPTAFKFNFGNFDPMPFPLDPQVTIKGIIPEKASLFKSALTPSKLHFITTDDTEYVAIFKHGDDLRQDQLILQMITLMDNVLRKENLDLKLTPYRVLATSTKHGFVQFIDSVSVAEAVAAEGTIHNYFRKYHPQESGPFGIAPEIMDTYVRSCAGYCVITYLLGVGDRHLDNLLLTTSGKLFHIDFGYILGRDPKPLPPSMKLSKEMVEAMGGVNSEFYQEFRKQCYTAFLHLRRHANLMLNLFSLMVDASVPDIALEPDKAVKKVQDKFRLESSEEEAVQYIQCLIDSSVTAVMPAIVEQIHKITQYIRK